MKLRQSVLVMLAVVGLSLPFSLSACSLNPDEIADREGAKNDPPATQKADRDTQIAEFRVPDDPGGRMVLRVLAPADRPPEKESSKPRPRRGPRSVENPSPPLPPQVVSLPRLPDGGLRKPPLPQLLSPEPLFGLEEAMGVLPQAQSFPAQERARLASPDVSQPVPLPRLGQPLADRAPLTDPTVDISLSSVLSATLPSRNQPAPFQRLTLPDPFENHETVKLKVSPAEERLPETGTSAPRK